MRRTARTAAAAALAAGALITAALTASTAASAEPVCDPDPRVCPDDRSITLGAGDGDLVIATASGQVSIGGTTVGTHPEVHWWSVTAAEGYSGSVSWTGTRRADGFDLTSAQPLRVAIASGAGDDNIILFPAPLDGSSIDLGPGHDLLQTHEGAGSLTIDLSAGLLNVPRPQTQGIGPTTVTGVEEVDVTAASVVAVGNTRPNVLTVAACTADIRSGGGDDRVMVRSDHDDRLADPTCEKTSSVDLGPGDDWARGYISDDVILAGTGNDQVIGGHGDDFILGGPGRDTIAGNKDNDTLVGGPGRDIGRGGPGTDRCRGVERPTRCELGR